MFLVEPDVVRRQTLVHAREQLEKLPCRLLGVVVARRRGSEAYGHYGSAYRHYYHENGNGSRDRDAARASARV